MQASLSTLVPILVFAKECFKIAFTSIQKDSKVSYRVQEFIQQISGTLPMYIWTIDLTTVQQSSNLGLKRGLKYRYDKAESWFGVVVQAPT